MKHRLKGLLALVLSLVMVLGMVTVGSASQSSGGGSAPTTYPVSIGGVVLTSGNISSYAGISFTPTDGTNPATLTLNNAAINDCIYADGNLTLVLEGDNTITNANGEGIVVSSGTLTITSSDDNATLGVSGTDKGIYAWSGGSVVISGGTVTARATNNTSGIGIEATDSITIGGDVNKNPKVNVGCATGLNASTVNILENSTVTITTNATAPAVGKAIDATTTLNFGGNWYQWSENGGSVNTSSNTNQLTVDAAKGIQTLTIGKIVQVSTYTVKFNANGGSGTMADVTGVSGNYTLPANGFNAPVGDEFFGWSVDPAGAERKLPGETMQITRDTTVYAIWKYATLGNQGGGYPGTPQPPSIYIPTVEDEPEVTAPKTFDGGIVSAVVVSILSATGGAWLAKKKD